MDVLTSMLVTSANSQVYFKKILRNLYKFEPNECTFLGKDESYVNQIRAAHLVPKELFNSETLSIPKAILKEFYPWERYSPKNGLLLHNSLEKTLDMGNFFFYFFY